MAAEYLTFKTERLLFRAFQQKDLENVFRGLSHPEVIRYYGVHFDNLEATQEQMDWFRELEEQESGKWFAICSADERVFYGGVGLNHLQKEHKKAEIGFWLLPEHWGKGIIPEAGSLICDYAFQQMDLHRIEALVESENQNSKKVLQKLGFQHEGCMRDCEIKNGVYISLDIYAKFRSSIEKG